jgi:hypothetical protein
VKINNGNSLQHKYPDLHRTYLSKFKLGGFYHNKAFGAIKWQNSRASINLAFVSHPDEKYALILDKTWGLSFPFHKTSSYSTSLFS